MTYGLAVAEQNTAKKPIFWARRTRKRAYHRFEWPKVVKPKKLFVRACWRIKKTLVPLRCTQRLAFGGGGTRKGASHIAEKRKTPASPGQRQNARPYLQYLWLLPKNQPPPCFDCQKCQKLTLGGYLGLSLSQKSILRALSCLYIPIYTHA